MQTGEFTPVVSASSFVATQVPSKKTLGLLFEQCVCHCDYFPVYSLLWVFVAVVLLLMLFDPYLKTAPRGGQSRKCTGLIRCPESPENLTGPRSTERGARAGTCISHREILFFSMGPPRFSQYLLYLIYPKWSCFSHMVNVKDSKLRKKKK